MPNKKLTTVAAEPTGEDGAIQVEVTLPVRPRRHQSRKGGQPDSSDAGSRARIPRITRLMALAIKFQEMVERGEVRDYADLARLGYVTRARITQIMNLLNLAPDIQEQLLLPESLTAKICERHLRNIVDSPDWTDQRRGWADLQLARRPPPNTTSRPVK
jgi:hypothetical protein